MTKLQLLKRLEEDTCDLRVIDVPTGDDYDIAWVVIEHSMAEPKGRIIGRGTTVLEALREAFD